MFTWCLGREWKVPVLNSSPIIHLLWVFGEHFCVQCSSALLGCLVGMMCKGTRALSAALVAMFETGRGPFYVVLAFWWFFFSTMNVSATLSLCVLMLRFLNTLSLGDENIWYNLLGQTSFCLHSTCLHWSPMFPEATVQCHTAACWCWQSGKQKEVALKWWVTEPCSSWACSSI